jgi:hypothetical protein
MPAAARLVEDHLGEPGSDETLRRLAEVVALGPHGKDPVM